MAVPDEGFAHRGFAAVDGALNCETAQRIGADVQAQHSSSD